MLSREESIGFSSDTDHSSDDENPFNDYVQAHKKSYVT